MSLRFLAPRCAPLTVILLVLTSLTLTVPRPAAARSTPTLQSDFHDAAHEFGVPEPVLLSVSYHESLWDSHDGRPSTSGGYGLMQLTHVDLLPDVDAHGRFIMRSVRHVLALHTLDTATRLLHEPATLLERDPAQNIRGGAALLARYATEPTGRRPESMAQWYGAVARYSGSSDSELARMFADNVFHTIRTGAARVTAQGQRVTLTPHAVSPDTRTLAPLHLQPRQSTPKATCPVELSCRFIPAAYHVNNPADPTNYGNYDVANRPKDGLAIRYIVIHDTEGSYASAINTFQDPTRYASANYVVRSSDGQVTQMVPNSDIAWHVGNYWANMHSIGIEHEGVAVKGASWYNEQLYETSAVLVRYLARKYHVPVDRAHILGHEEVPAFDPSSQRTQHWDPGPFWDWQRYMQLVLAPPPTFGPDNSPVIAIWPDFDENQPTITSCDSGPCVRLPAQPANFVYLRSAPSTSAPLIADPDLYPGAAAGTTNAADWGDKAVAGQEFVVAGRKSGWVAIYFGGRKAWFASPLKTPTEIPTVGKTITPRPGLASIPVYGRAYPEVSEYPSFVTHPEHVVSLGYMMPAGQRYVMTDKVTADVYWTPTQTQHAVVKGHTVYDQIFFNHRFALVKAADVTVRQTR